jgi:type IV pilus assembly protein PilM
MLFGPKKVRALGIDISELSVKIMQLTPQKGGFWPSAYSTLELPASIISSHTILKEEKLADYIIRAVKLAKNVNTNYVVASVPEAKSFVRILKMPKMAEEEIEGAIPWELEQDIPIPIEQVYMDWRIVREEADSNHIMVMATPKDYVDSLITTLKMAKLRPVALELESQATARALIGVEDSNEAVLLLDMSSSFTSFVIVSGQGSLEYTSSIPFGGSHLTESIATNLGITPKEAEKIKRDNGLLADSKKGNGRQAMLPILDNVVTEIRNVVKFHQDHSNLSKAVNKVVLCGGAANLKGMADYITARLNLGAGKPIDHIILGDPWVNVLAQDMAAKIPVTKEESLSYASSIGLALRGANL